METIEVETNSYYPWDFCVHIHKRSEFFWILSQYPKAFVIFFVKLTTIRRRLQKVPEFQHSDVLGKKLFDSNFKFHSLFLSSTKLHNLRATFYVFCITFEQSHNTRFNYNNFFKNFFTFISTNSFFVLL